MERKNWGALIRKVLLGMEDKKDLEDIKTMVAAYNYKNLRYFSILFSIVFGVISFLSIMEVTPVYEFPIVYLVVCMISFGIYLLTRFVYKPDTSGKAVLLTFYVLELVGYAYGYYTGVVHGPFPAVTFIVMILIMPILACDSPLRGNVLLIIVCIIFLIGSKRSKGGYIFSNDVINVVSFVLVSFFMNTNWQVTRMEDFKNRRIIKIQRDTDSLTGAMTKTAFEINTMRALRSVNCEGCLLVRVIDKFKNIYDSFGHSIGDFFIANTGRCILDCCRSSDFVGRFGGDEFVILMQGTLTKDNVQNKVHLMTESLKNFFRANTKYEHFSISVGCVLFSKGSERPSYQELFDKADHALYVAKNSGKDRCVTHGDQHVE